MSDKTKHRWFATAKLPNHADNTILRDQDNKPLFFVRPTEAVLVIGEEEYTEQYVDKMNEAISEAHDKICAELNKRLGTPKTMTAVAAG